MQIYRQAGCLPHSIIAICLSFTLGGCAVIGQDYVAPTPVTAAIWQAPQPHGGSVEALGNWWSQLNDPVLTRLLNSAEYNNPTIDKAWANIEKARATLSSTDASGMPSANGQASVARGKQQASEVATTRSAGLDASWELDLFGKLRRSTESARARVQARENDWHDARVSLAAEVADTYVQYRACGLLADAYKQELTSMSETAKATESLVRAGLTAKTEGSLVRASMASTTSAELAQRAQCELLVKSLVSLTGIVENELRQQLAEGGTGIPQPASFNVQSVPAQVLRQRPDLASRERELAAASADIGMAQADLYPSVSLSGSLNVSANGLTSSLASWSFGPTLSIPLFDGGRRRAAVDSAIAAYEATYADWRQTVRSVVKEVEQSLVRLDSAAKQAEQSERAAEEYRRYLVGAEAQWRAGSIGLLTLEESRRQALSSQIELINLRRNRVVYWIALYKSLGGDWQSASPASPPANAAYEKR